MIQLVSDVVGYGMVSKILSCLSRPADGDGVSPGEGSWDGRCAWFPRTRCRQTMVNLAEEIDELAFGNALLSFSASRLRLLAAPLILDLFAKDTRSAVVKLVKEFEVLASDVIGYGMVSQTTTSSRWRGRCA